ncbi:hypothetical protein Vretifemale_3298, partial [Volvox reticuliferus]
LDVTCIMDSTSIDAHKCERKFVQGAAGTSDVRFARGCSDRAVVFFEGDQILDDYTRDLLGLELWSPESHLTTLWSQLGSETSVLVVMPTTVAIGGQGCYGNFLAAMTAAGDPQGFKPQGCRATTHLGAILSACGYCCGCQDRAGMDSSGASQSKPAIAGIGLVGFSKGAVVVNQLLAEMAWREESLDVGAEASSALGPKVEESEPKPYQDKCWLPSAARPKLPPVAVLLDSIHAIHFLDAGLNCQGVHLTDARMIALLGKRHSRWPLVVHLHGTPRQWADRRRPWIVHERDRFLGLLREFGVPAFIHHYFAGQPPSLRQHFDVIRHVRLVMDGCWP